MLKRLRLPNRTALAAWWAKAKGAGFYDDA
jgi:hypothetical protein